MFNLKAMPGTPMSQEEMERQCKVVSEAAKATDYFSDDELESFDPNVQNPPRVDLIEAAVAAYQILGDFMAAFPVRSQADEVLMREGHAARNALATAIAKEKAHAA